MTISSNPPSKMGSFAALTLREKDERGLTHGDVSATASTPDVEGHLKANNQDAEVQVLCPLSQGMLPDIGVQRALVRRPIRWVILVHNLSFSLVWG